MWMWWSCARNWRRRPQATRGWCHALQKYGVAIVETDNHAGVLKHFTQLFGFREWCSYGASQPHR